MKLNKGHFIVYHLGKHTLNTVNNILNLLSLYIHYDDNSAIDKALVSEPKGHGIVSTVKIILS